MRRILAAIFFLSLLPAFLSAAETTNTLKRILVGDVSEAITPVTEKYIRRLIREAEAGKADAVLFHLDTPGGLLETTRSIVELMLNTKVDTMVFVAPKGARAGSAGVFITLSAKYAAMAPGCNIGAAHPVNSPGGDSKEDENTKTLMKKVLNDTVAFIDSISKVRNRNREIAMKTVSESISITGEEAKKSGLIDFIAENDQDLALQAYGPKADLKFIQAPKSWAERLLSVLANPNLSYFLLILGFYGILYEIIHPGTIFSGSIGAILLIVALFSMQTLPVNYAGVLLIALAFVLFVLEIYVTSFGLLSLGAIVSLVIGSAMLFDTDLPFMKVAVSTITAMVLLTGGIFVALAVIVGKSVRQRSSRGRELMTGEIGVVNLDFVGGKGKVKVHGEIWNAESPFDLKTGDTVRVISLEGLKLKVEPKS